MLPGSRSVYRWTMSMVTSPARKGDDHAAADPAGDPGPRRPGRAGTPLPHHPRRPDPHPLPDGPTQRPGHTPPQIAQLVRCSADTVRRVLKRYLAGGPTPCRTGPTPVSHPTTPPGGSRSWSGSPTWTHARLGWTVRCGPVGCWPTTWPG